MLRPFLTALFVLGMLAFAGCDTTETVADNDGVPPPPPVADCPQNNSPACAEPFALGNPTGGLEDINRYYELTLDQAGVYEVDMRSMPNESGLFVQVLDPDLSQVVRYEYPAGFPYSFFFEVNAPGPIQVVVQSGAGSNDEAYEFVVRSVYNQVGTSSCFNNTTPQCAVAAPLGQSITGVEDRIRYYRFEADRVGSYRLSTSLIPENGNFRFEVLNEQFGRIASQDFAGGFPGSFDFKVDAAQDVYVSARQVSIIFGTYTDLFAFEVNRN